MESAAGVAQSGALEGLISWDRAKEIRDGVAQRLVDAGLTLAMEELVGVRYLALPLQT